MRIGVGGMFVVVGLGGGGGGRKRTSSIRNKKAITVIEGNAED